MTNHLIVYAKRPLAGYTKTRLAAGIGAEEAAGVYARLLYSLLSTIESAVWESHLDKTLSLASDADIPFFKSAFPEWKVTAQVKGDLGKRMSTSIQQEFQSGAEKVILIGSDIPFLYPNHIQLALETLKEIDVVFGPTPDGGFYLIGTNIPTLDIFTDIEWSTPTVLAGCVQNAEKQGYSTTNIAELFDMDTKKEYLAWQQRLTGRT